MRFRPTLLLLASAFLLAGPILRAEDVRIGTWTFKTDKTVSIGVVKSESGASEEEEVNQGYFKLDWTGDHGVLVNEAQKGLGKGGGKGRMAKTVQSWTKGPTLTLTAGFEDEAKDLDQVLQVQVGTYAPFKVWLHRKGAGDPIKVELGNGKTAGPAIAKVKIQGGDLTYTD
ncbi:MAG TPA: hypothetical protein VK188_16660 [Holophaga sp.]|nr:hypothetical protein [Holophaga sp.]